MRSCEVQRQVELGMSAEQAFTELRGIAAAAQWGLERADAAAGTMRLWAPGALSQGRAQTTVHVTITDGNPGGAKVVLRGVGSRFQVLPGAQLRRTVDGLAAAVRDPGAPRRLARPRSAGQRMIGLLLTVALAAAVAIAATAPLPVRRERGREVSDLPSVALGNAAVYRIQIGLIVLYGGLLILTPVYRGVVRGTLPTEVSARGAKFGEDVDDAVLKVEERVKELEGRANQLSADLATVRIETPQEK
jgi:hypothetical protein